MSSLWDDGYGDYVSYYTPSYTSKKSKGGWKSKYSGGWSKSWSSFSFTVDYEDNDNDLFVKDPINYLTPTAKEIKKKVKVNKQTAIDTIKELARVCYFKMIDEKDYVSEKFVDDMEGQEAKKSLYDSIFDQYIPGFTPLEQAISIYLKIKNSGEVDEDGQRGETEDDDMNMQKGLDFDRNIYSDPTINEQLELNDISKERKMEILNHLSLVGQFGSEFKVEKEISEKIVSNSDEYAKMIMRDYAQFHMIDLYQKMFPNFKTKFLTKDLTVNVPVDRKEQIQKIIIILDYSGSMCDVEKQIWVNAILIDRFRYVMKGEAEVFFSYFVDDPSELDFQHIKNREDVIEFWRHFSNDPNGGMTEVGDMVDYIANEISSGKLCNLQIDLSQEKPEILVINDGQDDIGTEQFPYKVNAVSLMEFSNELKDLCNSTGGKQIEITYNGDVYSHSAELGAQLIKI
jgi:uncharacterized protein with von Willebrand factor type A (vWA) domain